MSIIYDGHTQEIRIQK